jgi:Terpene cyclase DEP1
VIFLSWSRRDARDKKIAGWWIVLVSNLVVGLSLALPLYLLKRLNAARTQEQAGTLAAGPAID